MKNYRIAFLMVLTVAVLLAIGMGYLGWQTYGRAHVRVAESQAGAASPSPGAVSGGKNATAGAPVETPLAPVRGLDPAGVCELHISVHTQGRATLYHLQYRSRDHREGISDCQTEQEPAGREHGARRGFTGRLAPRRGGGTT